MTYKIHYSPEAAKDMEEVWDGVWEASRDYDTSDRYVDDFMDEIAKKAKAPKTGIPLYYKGLFSGFYYVNFKAYKAFYRIDENHIEVVRILLSKMDYMRVLFGES